MLLLPVLKVGPKMPLKMCVQSGLISYSEMLDTNGPDYQSQHMQNILTNESTWFNFLFFIFLGVLGASLFSSNVKYK